MRLNQEKTVLELIQYFGSVDKMSKKTSLLRPSIYLFLKGQEIPEHIAKRIEAKTLGKFNYKTLISEKTRCYLEIEKFPYSLVEIPISHIIISDKVPHFRDKKALSASQQSACIDQGNHLTYGLEAIEACKKQGKKSVLAWRISLSALWKGKYKVEDLVKTFDPVERTAIGIALEIFIGNRQGFRTDLIELVENYPQVSLEKGTKTRNRIVEYLGFGSDYTYRQLKNILQSNCCSDLIRKVRHSKISLSKAAALADLPHDKQIIQLSKIS